MSWDSKPSYPPSARCTVTIKATAEQRGRWTLAAKRRKMARGAFIALAADTYVLFEEARLRAFEEYELAMHPGAWREP